MVRTLLVHLLISEVNGSRGVVTGFCEDSGYPIVKFANDQIQTIKPEQWTYELGGTILAQRKQVPLNLAYALSIHKSQGMTIDRLEIHLNQAFECGMAYVALSRSTSLKGLRLVQFNEKVVWYIQSVI